MPNNALIENEIYQIDDTLKQNHLEPHQKQILLSLRTLLVIQQSHVQKVELMWPWYKIGRWVFVAFAALMLPDVYRYIIAHLGG